MFTSASGVLAVGIIVALFSMPVAASDEIEQRDLALIQEQLEQIEHVIDRLEQRQAQRSPMRMYLDIPQLRVDVRAIASGIDQYLSPPRRTAREVIPVAGDYLVEGGLGSE